MAGRKWPLAGVAWLPPGIEENALAMSLKALGSISSSIENGAYVGPITLQLLDFTILVPMKSFSDTQDIKWLKVALIPWKWSGDPESWTLNPHLPTRSGASGALIALCSNGSDSRLSKWYQKKFWKEFSLHFQTSRGESWQRAHQLSLFWNAGRPSSLPKKGLRREHCTRTLFLFFLCSPHLAYRRGI